MPKHFHNVYEGEILCFCTVTFGQKITRLTSRPVYCSRFYGKSMRPQYFSCSIVQRPRLGNECVPNSFILLAWLMLGVVCGEHAATVETRDAFIFDIPYPTVIAHAPYN